MRGSHLQFGQGVQVDLCGDHGSVAQSTAYPVQRVAEDQAVGAALLRVPVCLAGDMTALQLLESHHCKGVAQAVRVTQMRTPWLRQRRFAVRNSCFQADFVIGVPISVSQNMAGSSPFGPSISNHSRSLGSSCATFTRPPSGPGAIAGPGPRLRADAASAGSDRPLGPAR